MRLRCPERRGVHSGFLRDVSRGGMFLRLVDPEEVGSRLGFELSLPGRRQKVRGTGEVAWARPSYEGPGRPPGMAVRFLTLEVDGARELTDLLGAPPRADVQLVTPERRAVALDSGVDGEEAAGDGPNAPGVERDAMPAVAGPRLAAPAEPLATPSSRPEPRARSPLRPLLIAGLAVAALLLAVTWRGDRGGREHAAGVGERAPGVAAAPVRSARPPAAQGSLTTPPAMNGAPDRSPPPAPAGPPQPAARAAAAGLAAGAPARELIAVRWEQGPAGGTRVVLAFDGPLGRDRVRSSRIGGEAPRQVLQLAGVRAAAPGARWEPGTEELRAVRTGFHPAADGGELHVVLDLVGEAVELGGLEVAGAELRLELVTP